MSTKPSGELRSGETKRDVCCTLDKRQWATLQCLSARMASFACQTEWRSHHEHPEWTHRSQALSAIARGEPYLKAREKLARLRFRYAIRCVLFHLRPRRFRHSLRKALEQRKVMYTSLWRQHRASLFLQEQHRRRRWIWRVGRKPSKAARQVRAPPPSLLDDLAYRLPLWDAMRCRWLAESTPPCDNLPPSQARTQAVNAADAEVITPAHVPGTAGAAAPTSGTSPSPTGPPTPVATRAKQPAATSAAEVGGGSAREALR